MEFLSPEGLRLDGRRPEELRKIRCKLGVFSRADGSAYFEQGNTKVIASVYGPREVISSKCNQKVENKRKAMHNKAIINCEYSMATFSTGERRKKSKGDRRATEISLVIRQTFELTEALGVLGEIFKRHLVKHQRRYIGIDQRWNSDAGFRLFVCRWIHRRDSYSRFVHFPRLIVDLNYLEDSAGGPDLPLALLPQSGKVTTLQMDSKLPLDVFEQVMSLAAEGCRAIYKVLLEEVETYTSDMSQSLRTESQESFK